MLTSLQTLLRLATLRWLGVFICALATLLSATGNASALEPAQTKTGVWGFDFAADNSVGLFRAASTGKHLGNRLAGAEAASGSLLGARGAANEVPGTLARVIPGNVNPATLGRPGAADVFVAAADDIAGLNAAQLAERLAIQPSSSFTIFRFATPAEGLASPILRSDPGFVGGGLTAGGAREFILSNGPIPAGAIRSVVGP